MKKRYFLFATLLLVAISLGACGGSSGTATPTGDTSTLTLSLSQDNSQILASISPKWLGGKLNFKDAFDSTTYPYVKCVDGAGNAYTGATSASGAAITGIPTNTPVNCYIMNSSGVAVTQIVTSDTGSFGGQFDTDKLSADATMTAVMNATAGGAVSDSANTTHLSSSTEATGVVDITGEYTMTCQHVKDSVTQAENATYTTQYCTQFAEQNPTGKVYMHQISGTNSSGTTVYAAGAWSSKAGFELCGSTEGLDNLPAGLTVADSLKVPFTWHNYFTGFASTSTSAEIAAMIKNFGNDATIVAAMGGGAPTYDAYRVSEAGCGWVDSEGVQGLTDEAKLSICASMYYWTYIQAFVGQNPEYSCVPMIEATWTTVNNLPSATISAKASSAGTTRPMNRYDFMPLQYLLDSSDNPIGRLSSKEFWTFSSYDPNGGASVACVKTMGLVVQWDMPATAPLPTETVTIEFVNTTSVTAVSGIAADSLMCNASGGGSTDFAPNGFFLEVLLTRCADAGC